MKLPFKRPKPDFEAFMKGIRVSLLKKGYPGNLVDDLLEEIEIREEVKTLYQKDILGHVIGYHDPIVFYIKRDGSVDIIENASPGWLEVETSDGKVIRKYLDGNRLYRMPDINADAENMRVWFVHEETPFPLPVNYVQDGQLFDRIIVNLEADIRADTVKEHGLDVDWRMMAKLAFAGFIAILIFGQFKDQIFSAIGFG